MTSIEGAWVQAAGEDSPIFLVDGSTLAVDKDAERQELVRRVSSVTANGRPFRWPSGSSVYVLDASDGTYDVVLEAPRTDYKDSSGRRILVTLLLGAVPAGEAEGRLTALWHKVSEHGVTLAAPPADMGLYLGGLVAAGRRGCLSRNSFRRLSRVAQR